MLAYLKNGLWLDNARHANAMAQRMAQGLKSVAGATLLHPVEANELFVVLPEDTVAHLGKSGIPFLSLAAVGAEERRDHSLGDLFRHLERRCGRFYRRGAALKVGRHAQPRSRDAHQC